MQQLPVCNARDEFISNPYPFTADETRCVEARDRTVYHLLKRRSITLGIDITEQELLALSDNETLQDQLRVVRASWEGPVGPPGVSSNADLSGVFSAIDNEIRTRQEYLAREESGCKINPFTVAVVAFIVVVVLL